jgi:hypothetical protein
MFLGLPDPDPLVRGMDSDLAPDPSNQQCCGSESTGSICFWASRILLSTSKNGKKNPDSYCLVTGTSFELFIFEKDVNVPLKSNEQKNSF